MKPLECQFEAEVLAAVLESRWPMHAGARLREHAATCPLCADVVAVASAFNDSLEPLRAAAELPDASRVWWQSQMRARREAVKAAGRPIAAVQMIAFGCAVALLSACFGATSTWFQAVLKRVTASLASFDLTAFLGATAALFAEHGVLAVGLAALIFVIPTAVIVVLARD